MDSTKTREPSTTPEIERRKAACARAAFDVRLAEGHAAQWRRLKCPERAAEYLVEAARAERRHTVLAGQLGLEMLAADMPEDDAEAFQRWRFFTWLCGAEERAAT